MDVYVSFAEVSNILYGLKDVSVKHLHDKNANLLM
jgi:hypothetical protein